MGSLNLNNLKNTEKAVTGHTYVDLHLDMEETGEIEETEETEDKEEPGEIGDET